MTFVLSCLLSRLGVASGGVSRLLLGAETSKNNRLKGLSRLRPASQAVSAVLDAGFWQPGPKRPAC